MSMTVKIKLCLQNWQPGLACVPQFVDPCSRVWVRVFINGYVYAYKTSVLFTANIVGTLR